MRNYEYNKSFFVKKGKKFLIVTNSEKIMLNSQKNRENINYLKYL